MYSHTKKVGSIGRYGPRIARTLRERIKPIEDDKRKKTSCRFCGKPSIKRRTSGVWECRSCNTQFTGGSHIPTTKSK